MTIDGKKLEVTPASFADARRLAKAVERAVKGTRLELPDGIDSEVDADTITSILSAVLAVDISDDVEDALFECAKRATVGDEERITRDFFEPVERREYFYPVMFEIMKVNLSPFFSGIASKLTGLAPELESSLKQRFTSTKKSS